MTLLDPNDRRLLLDALRPPDEFTLDFAVGTTFSLDLLALLTAPLGFTRFELQENEGADVAEADAHLVLRTLREFADRITLFCQAGRIAAPPNHRPLLSMLEQMVVEVAPPTPNRVFHPKVWALRFVGPEGAVAYRLLVLSRNLTFAKSWDTVLVLDGELQDRVNAIKANHPLGDFFAALPAMARRGLTGTARNRIAQLEAEIRKVRFDYPSDIEDIAFHPLGIPSARNPFNERVQRMVVVSPFLSSGKLAELSKEGRGHVLISRPDSLEKLPARDLAGFSKIYVLNPQATPLNEDDALSRDVLDASVGLHAKCFIADDGWQAHVWTGSANATTAAFDGNVEFLVQLTGKASRLGTEAFLSAAEKDAGIMPMLVEFKPAAEGKVDTLEERLEEMVETARTAIASGSWQVRIEADGENQFGMVLDGATSVFPKAELQGVAVYPITLGPLRELEASTEPLRWNGVSTEAITSFFAFDVVRQAENRTSSCRFVLNLPLLGAPANRQEVLLRSMLRDRAQVIRFLLLLLGENDDDSAAWRHLVKSATGPSTGDNLESEALLEPLLRALEQNPSRLEHVERLLRDLGAGEGGTDTPVPPGLMEIFQPIWDAREKVSK